MLVDRGLVLLDALLAQRVFAYAARDPCLGERSDCRVSVDDLAAGRLPVAERLDEKSFRGGAGLAEPLDRAGDAVEVAILRPGAPQSRAELLARDLAPGAEGSGGRAIRWVDSWSVSPLGSGRSAAAQTIHELWCIR